MIDEKETCEYCRTSGYLCQHPERPYYDGCPEGLDFNCEDCDFLIPCPQCNAEVMD